ncbi:MAG: murein hydrolase activator EnvC family protein [Actinomycetota bacterium]
MGQKLSHMLAAGVAVGTLLVPSLASWAGPRGDLRATKHRLAQVRGFIDHGSTRAASLKKQINRLNRRISTAQIALNTLDSEIRRISSSVRSAHARIGSIQREIDRVEHLATEQAVALYKAGSTDALDALLTSSSLGELDSRIELLGAAAAENTGALVRFGRLRTQIRQEYRALFDMEARLNESRATETRLMRSLSFDKKLVSRAFSELKAKLHDRKETERHLEGAAAEIRHEILTAKVGAELAALGISSEGFIWPLNGGVTSPFGERWGRLHAGIDINGYTGQPIAAAKSGVPIYVGAGMSGYGNVVILDHGGGLSTLYAHLSSFAVTSGSVEQGDIIGYVGCTGSCYGDHLHFEVHLGGNPVDPMSYLP